MSKNYPRRVRAALWSRIDEMAARPEEFANRPGIDFTRSRKITLAAMLRLLVCIEGGSVGHELLKHFGYVTSCPSASALCQQRGKLASSALPYLFRAFCADFLPKARYRGYRLLASDGSEFNIARNPGDPETFFGPGGKSSKGYNAIHVVALYDLLGRTYEDAVIQPGRKKNEFCALCDLTDRLGPNAGRDLLICDRGFSCHSFYAHAIEAGADFLVRTKDKNAGRLLGVKGIESMEALDVTVERMLTRSASASKRQRPKEAGKYRLVSREVAFDYLGPGKAMEYAMTLRVVRIEVADGVWENLVTSLSADFTPEDMRRLYRLRWGIETSFRELKHAVGAVAFHSRRREFIEQEIWARLILYNFCSAITRHVAISQRSTKHVYQVNYTMAIKVCHHFLGLRGGVPPPDVEALVASFVLPVRPGRSYERRHRFQMPVSFTYRFS
jgi:hypothetical protein